MAFNWMGMFSVHEYQGLRDYLIDELRNVGSQANQIDVEIKRIGKVSILWDTDDQGKVTEKRLGLLVSPANSSLAKLMKAYIAVGGNPFDICMFLDPEEGVEFIQDPEGGEGAVMRFLQPYGGVASVRTRESPTATFDSGGELIYGKNFRLRAGKEIRFDRAETVGVHIESAREWANQGIKEKRNDLEWRIIKLMDLQEQLRDERIECLYHTVAGMVDDVPLQDTDDHFHTLKHHIATIDKIVFELDDDDNPLYGTVNLPNLAPGNYDFLIPPRQMGEDDWIGGKTPFNMVMAGEDRKDIAANLGQENEGLDEEV